MEKFNERLTNKQLAGIAVRAAEKVLSAIDKIEQNAATRTPECSIQQAKLLVCLQMAKPRLICDRH